MITKEQKAFVILVALFLLSVAVWGFTLFLVPHLPPDASSQRVPTIVIPVRPDLPPQSQIKLITKQLRRCEQDILDMRMNRLITWEKRRQYLLELQQQHDSLQVALNHAEDQLKAEQAGGTAQQK